MVSDVGLGFLLVTGAGMSTALGAACVFSERLVQLASKRVLAAALALSAGVMLYVSFVEIFVKAQGAFADAGQGESDAYLSATLCFFAGCVLMMVLDKVVHALDASGLQSAAHELDFEAVAAAQKGGAAVELAPKQQVAVVFDSEETKAAPEEAAALAVAGAEPAPGADKKLVRMGIMTALAIAIHNFPEGLATFVATLDDPAVGASLAVAIGIRKVPEGLCGGMPLYYATGNRWKAFGWALLSGLTEPIGALIGWAALQGRLDDKMYGVLFGLVGGMMVMIVLHELLPTAHRYDPEDTVVTPFTLLGMAIMSSSLVLFLY